MGLLLDVHNGELVTLGTGLLVGRSGACVLALDDPQASAEHAAIAWTGERWEVRDLGSANGTWLNGRRLDVGERAELVRDARLGFGRRDGRWLLADDQPAGPVARDPRSGDTVHAVAGLLAVPSPSNPRAIVFCGGDGVWRAEVDHVTREISDGDVLDIEGADWLVRLPRDLCPTLLAEAAPPRLAGAALWFTPSLDEERVEVRIRNADGREAILSSRSCHYMLLVLARLRLRDAAAGIAEEHQGWVHAGELADMLRYGADRLNIEIFRARSTFARLGYADATQLVERRPALRQLRIGPAHVHVLRGDGAPA